MMKKIYLILISLTLFSCVRETAEQRNITVSFEMVNVKTAFTSDRSHLIWENGDKIGIYHDADGVQNTTLEYTGDNKMTIALPYSSQYVYAMFPYDESAGSDANSLCYYLPHRQYQSIPGVLTGSRWPMTAAAKIENSHADLLFTPLTALWALNIYSTSPETDESVTSVRITPTVNTGFCGNAVIDITSPTAAFTSGDSSKSVELTITDVRPLGNTKPSDAKLFEDQLYVNLARQVYKSVRFEISTTAGKKYILTTNENEIDSTEKDVIAFNINLSKGTISVLQNFGTEELIDEDYTYSSLEEVIREPEFEDIDEDIIPDFSRVGYHYSDDDIPHYDNIIATLTPTDDETDRSDDIQAAIDMADGISNGVVLLMAGDYYIGKTLTIEKSHVVLRGELDNAGSPITRLIATGDKSMTACVRLGSSGKTRVVDGGSATRVTEDYVPVGRLAFCVEDASRFNVGDRILIYRPGTQQWLHDIRMDRISDGENWNVNDVHLEYERTIAGVSGNRIMIDAPVVMAMDSYYGGGYVMNMYRDRIVESGVEDLAGFSGYDSSKKTYGSSVNPIYPGGIFCNDEDHCQNAVQVLCAEHCWVKSVTGKYFVCSCVELGSGSKNVTVLDCHSYYPISEIKGSRRYAFSANDDSSMGLFKGCTAEYDRHQFVTTQYSTGPLVFTDCSATNCLGETGPHCFWATGVLYDYVRVDARQISVQDSDYVGTGASHGWQGANHVLWNCEAPEIVCQSPWTAAGRNPSGRNYCIGCIGTKVLSSTSVDGKYLTDRPDGTWYPDPGAGHSNSEHVTSGTYYGATANGLSLYEAQLSSRKATGIRAIPAEWYK